MARKPSLNQGSMMILGAGAGLAVGAALDSVAVGTAVGAGAGLLFGMLVPGKKS